MPRLAEGEQTKRIRRGHLRMPTLAEGEQTKRIRATHPVMAVLDTAIQL